MNLLQMDLPGLDSRTPEGLSFFAALCKSPDQTIFNLRSVQILIDHHDEYWYRISVLYNGVPVTIMLILFWYWSNVVLPKKFLEFEVIETQHIVLRVLIGIVAIYLLLIELSTIVSSRGEAIRSASRLYSIAAPVLLLVNIFRQNTDEVGFWRVQSWTTLLVWLRFAIFLRTVPRFNWLMRMIRESFRDMLVFLVVFFFAVFAFADAFMSIERILVIRKAIERTEFNTEDNIYEKYFKEAVLAWQRSFLTALGEFDGDLEHYNEADWMIFFLCCILNIILLLNLLISIISETYSRISSSSVQTSYGEKAAQIRYLRESVFGMFGRAEFDATNTLYIAQAINRE